MLLSIAAGCLQPRVPTLVFKYTDAGIHEDFYKLIKFSCDEICTSKEQANKCMRLWCTFLESVLSVSSRSLGSEDHEVPSASRHHGAKSAGMSIRRRDESFVAEAVASSTKQAKPSSNADGNTPLKQVNTASISVGLVASAERPANSDTVLAVEEGIQAGMKINSGELGINS